MKIKIKQVTVEFTMPDEFKGNTNLSFTWHPDKPPSSRLYSYDKQDCSLMELHELAQFLELVSRAGSEINQVVERLIKDN